MTLLGRRFDAAIDVNDICEGFALVREHFVVLTARANGFESRPTVMIKATLGRKQRSKASLQRAAVAEPLLSRVGQLHLCENSSVLFGLNVAQKKRVRHAYAACEKRVWRTTLGGGD